jgi:hypothetical protein
MAMTMRLAATAFGLLAALAVEPLSAAEFTSEQKATAEIAKKLSIPIYFTVPDTARIELPKSINTSDKLVDFHHPDAKGAKYGLRIVVAKRGGFGQRMAKSGLIQTGDILLSFRPEWAGGGAYPNIQMGVSHAGTAFTRNGEIRHVDNPLNAEFNGSGLNGSFDSSDYRELKFIHVVRPRNLTKAERANIDQWAARLLDNAGKIYPQELEFNSDYNAPKYQSDKSLTFVKKLGAAGLLQHPPKQALFCSEFAWSLLALRNCDPTSSSDAFKATRVPSCISPIHRCPRPATIRAGNGATTGSALPTARSRSSWASSVRSPRPTNWSPRSSPRILRYSIGCPAATSNWPRHCRRSSANSEATTMR